MTDDLINKHELDPATDRCSICGTIKAGIVNGQTCIWRRIKHADGPRPVAGIYDHDFIGARLIKLREEADAARAKPDAS